MFFNQIEKNKLLSFKHLIKTKGYNEDFVKVNGNIYTYSTKRGAIKNYIGFNSFNEYKKSEFYPRKVESVNGFYFVAL